MPPTFQYLCKTKSYLLERKHRLSGYANIKLLSSNFQLTLHSRNVKTRVILHAIHSFIHVTCKVFVKCRQKCFSIKNSDSIMKLRIRYCNKLAFLMVLSRDSLIINSQRQSFTDILQNTRS